jgi:capsular polysaccharide export protein
MVTRLRKLPQWLRLIAGHLLLTDSDRGQATLVTSMDLADHPTLRVILGRAPAFHSRLLPSRTALYIGWGRKWSGRRAVAIAKANGTDFCLLEDGFLRSVEREDLGVSLIFDQKGIYYDATGPSALEDMIAATLSKGEEARARAIMAAWRDMGLSKYNTARDHKGQLPPRYVLVADQVAGDLSIECGLADVAAFDRMLEAALDENPNKTIIVKLHPDALKSSSRRHFDPETLGAIPRVRVILDNCHASHLIKNAETVYTVTSQVGFEALIWGKPVRCFGMPFYAGWGLTDDELPSPDRRQPVTLEQLVHGALVKYPSYIDPVTMQSCEPERAFAHVGLQRRKRLEFQQEITALGFSRWKRPFIKSFLQGSNVVFARRPGAQLSSATALWGSAAAPTSPKDMHLLRIEDGFLRSSGLGSDLVRPLSLVIDDVGIYYDATRSSRLERTLETQELDNASIQRARALRDKIIQLDLTKYNLGNQAWNRPDTQNPVILVVGQVETDASIKLGSPDVKSNIELLRRVRQENPSAYIVYKPHPDVLAGLRRQGNGEGASHEIADEVLTHPVSLGELMGKIDELHTMTSLMGFEALIRGAKVVCHGLPFYAGWGLTQDRVACERRSRRLSVEELVHGALITYPRYFNYDRNCFVEPEQAVEQLAAMSKCGPETRSWQRKILRAAILAWLKLKGSSQ